MEENDAMDVYQEQTGIKISKCVENGGTAIADDTLCLNNEPKTWDLANKLCESMDAKMITINDKPRNNQVSAVVTKVKTLTTLIIRRRRYRFFST